MVLPPCVVWFPHSHLALFYPCYQDIILPHWQDDGFRVTFTIKICYSPNRAYFLGAIYSYKVALQVIGVLLAFSIRKVKIKGLNDSKEISAIIYITSVLLVVVITITMALGDYVNVNSGVFALGVSTASTVVLGFLFIPKVGDYFVEPVKLLFVILFTVACNG